MKKKILALILGSCVLLGGCSLGTPKLLDPAGDVLDSAKVEKGKMYNINTYESAVTSEFKEVALGEDAAIKSANVQLGQEVKAGQSLLTLDKESAGSNNADIASKIQQMEADNAYLNQLAEYDIQILQYEYQLLIEQGGNIVYERRDKQAEIEEAQAKLAQRKIEQQKEIAELQAKLEAGITGSGEIVAPWDGVVVYLNSGSNGSVISAGTVVAIVAKKDSKILFGDFIELNTLENAHKVYAVIGDKEYNVTNVPYNMFELNQRRFLKLPVYSTFYINDQEGVELGEYASIVVITDYVESALHIPSNALFSDEEGYYVYKIKGEDRKRVNVTIGRSTETAVEITSGLKKGDEVYVKP